MHEPHPINTMTSTSGDVCAGVSALLLLPQMEICRSAHWCSLLSTQYTLLKKARDMVPIRAFWPLQGFMWAILSLWGPFMSPVEAVWPKWRSRRPSTDYDAIWPLQGHHRTYREQHGSHAKTGPRGLQGPFKARKGPLRAL